MNIIRGIIAAFSTYSVIPMPHINWNEKATRYAISFFPLVGVVIGFIMFGWYSLCSFLEAPNSAFAAISVAIPVLLSGGIHLDGYMDTIDAISSHSDKERRLEIMKDSHPGAFACIYVALYFLIQYAFFQSINEKSIIFTGAVFVISRSLSAITASLMPSARKSGMLSDMLKTPDKTGNNKNISLVIFPVFIVIIIMILLLRLNIFATLIMFTTEIVWVAIYCLYMKISIGGVTGDTSGFFLQISEIIGIIIISSIM